MTANGYPGNPALPNEVKERVLTTFDQTLSLYDEGQLDEVVAGCDLILEMDERFEPAKKLRQKAKDPAAPIDMSTLYDLRNRASGQAPAGGEEAEGQLLQAVEELNKGNYEAAIEICNQVLASDPSNEEAQRVGQQANERLEAGPFIKQFLQEADDAIDAGNPDAARGLIEKAKSLDPLHPDIAPTTARLESAGASGAAPAESAGFNFGGDSSPFASAFGGGEPAGEGGDNEPAPAGPESADVDFAAPAAEPPSTDFSFSAEASDEPAEPEAADFGFTLEADASEAPTVTPAPEEPAVGEAQTFDFSTGDVEVTDEDQKKISTYLADGDALFESGDYQGAIDAWSKIFLIDVTNEQASERIETAKEKKREADTKLDDLLATGISAYDRGDYSTAREIFEEVIAQDPDNFRAQEYLEKLADHSAATGEAKIPPPPPPPPPSSEPSLTEDDDFYAEGTYQEPAEAPPPKPAAAGLKAKTAPKRTTSGKSPKGMIIAAVVVLVLAVGGYLGWTMFAGGGDEVTTDSSITQGKINRAKVIAGQGDFAQAISILSSVEAGDPMREQALQLIAQYKQQQAQTGGMVGGRPAIQVREELLTQARDAFSAEDYVAAKSSFEEAAKIKALDPADREMYDVATRQVSKLDAASALFAQGSYGDAIEEIDSILAAEPDNVSARKMLINAHYNLGVLSLRNRDLDQAIDRFEYVLQQDPNDSMAQRSLDIARQYQNQTKDLMYEIFVKYLPLRS